MLAPIKHLLNNKRIILASGSPRRQQLINCLGIEAELCPSTFEENLNPKDFKEFTQFIEAIAAGKADEVYQRLQSAATQTTNSKVDGDVADDAAGDAVAVGGNGVTTDNLLVIAADTLVTLDDEIYGKPKDAKDAVRMLTNLSGRCNRVYTGVALRYAGGIRKFTEIADVYFGELTSEQIQDYVDTGHPLDKAGAYGVQGLGGTLISKINGDFYCVMGLPLHRLCCELCKLFLEKNSCIK